MDASIEHTDLNTIELSMSNTVRCVHFLKGTSKNALFPRWLRQLRARILMYDVYTAVLRAVLPCPHEKITIFRGALNFRALSWLQRGYFNNPYILTVNLCG